MASTYTWHERDVLVGGHAWWHCTSSSLRPREARGLEEGEISGRKRRSPSHEIKRCGPQLGTRPAAAKANGTLGSTKKVYRLSGAENNRRAQIIENLKSDLSEEGMAQLDELINISCQEMATVKITVQNHDQELQDHRRKLDVIQFRDMNRKKRLI